MIQAGKTSGMTNVSSGRVVTKGSSSSGRQPIVDAPIRSKNVEFYDYVALDKFRKETTQKAEETNRAWKAKYDPWYIDECREMYANMAKNRSQPPPERVIPSSRPEWKQPTDILPPISKRLPGQRRRRILGAFPQTESDKIGWRLLPEHAIDIYGSRATQLPPLPAQYRLSNWPVESFS